MKKTEIAIVMVGVVLISFFSKADQTAKDKVEQTGMHKTDIDASSIGVSYALVGRFGKIGQKHIITGEIGDTFNYHGNTVIIATVDGKDYKGIIDIELFHLYPIGTKVKFEVVELAQLKIISSLNNRDMKNDGEMGCALYYEVKEIISVATPE